MPLGSCRRRHTAFIVLSTSFFLRNSVIVTVSSSYSRHAIMVMARLTWRANVIVECADCGNSVCCVGKPNESHGITIIF